MTHQTNSNHILSTLHTLIMDTFDLKELKILCFKLGIKYENIPGGDTVDMKSMGLIESLQHQNRLPELVEQCKKERPLVDWDAIYQEEPAPRPETQPPVQPVPGASDSKRWLLGIILVVTIVVAIGLFGVVRSGVMCAYHEPSDYATIERIIKAESQAVNEGNLEIIEDIFAPNATIQQTESVDGTTNIKEWFDPISHYSPLFANTKFSGAQHTDIEGSVTGNYAKFTSGSKGSYVTGDYHGEYDNEAGNPDEEEVWTLAKNFWGCWQITRFEFH